MFITTILTTPGSHLIGDGDLIIDCENRFTETQIKITGPTSGTMTITVQPPNGDFYEAVTGGVLDLAISKSITISNYRIGKVKLVMSVDADFNAEVDRY